MKLPTTWAKYAVACVLALGLGSLTWTAQETQTKNEKWKERNRDRLLAERR